MILLNKWNEIHFEYQKSDTLNLRKESITYYLTF